MLRVPWKIDQINETDDDSIYEDRRLFEII